MSSAGSVPQQIAGHDTALRWGVGGYLFFLQQVGNSFAS
jgi:hypothetical protein